VLAKKKKDRQRERGVEQRKESKEFSGLPCPKPALQTFLLFLPLTDISMFSK
jgi:hypothetical protein